MRPSLKTFRTRVAERAQSAAGHARSVAAGSEQPAGQGPTVPQGEPKPGARERATMRRRARRLRRLREAQLRDLGLLVVELERRGRSNPELVKRKAAALRALDDELRAIAAALADDESIDQVVAAGVAGSCSSCGALLSNDDRFCAHCGTPRGKAKTDAQGDSGQLVGASASQPQ